ncbi:hypothetical protein KIH74_07315 [Kineosporia sp. J2-2]|uniref:N-acetyltransferase domain-containing protein n=1 Tax=Kineosporia corallincola TaxID=2835133 RepID=A0ABS5TGK3_9ACTN|nr:hypothetical protein [Kineosporia corallincola]MBT0768729.1 hypothetical protein [Kineosporia corallincola]
MSEASETIGTRRWFWPEDLTAHRVSLRAMLIASIEDEGILGYGDEITDADGDAFADELARGLRDGSTHVLLGEDDSGVFAMCVMRRPAMANCRHLAEVSKAYLAPRARGSGAVLELALAVAERLTWIGVERIQIDVREHSHAHRVWRGLGFETFGVLDDYSRYGGARHRGHFMTVTVPDLLRNTRTRIGRRRQTADTP